MSRSLLDVVQDVLTRTYRIEPLRDPGRFVLGEHGWRRRPRPPEGSPDDAQLLVEERERAVRLGVYFPRSMIATLEAHPPQRGLNQANVDAFATFVEEVDHLLTVADRWRRGRPVSRVELELQANVSKHLVLSRFLAGRRRRLCDGRRAWLHAHLFGRVEWTDDDPAVRARYRDAARWAVRFLERWRALAPAKRVASLRRFHRATMGEKLDWIRAA